MPVWEAMRLNRPGESIVVVPSVAPDATQGGAVVQALEERFLFLLFLLRQPRLQVIYVTGRPVPEAIVEYYLGAAAGRHPAAGARAGCTWWRPTTARRAPLAAKLLERPRVLAQVRALIPDPARCHLVPYTTSDARARPRAGARDPAVRRRPASAPVRHEDRLPAPVRGRRGRAPARPRGPARRRRRRRRRSPTMRAAKPTRRERHRQAQRGRRGTRQRGRRPARPARHPAPPTSPPSCAAASRRWPSSIPTSSLGAYLAQLGRRRRDRRGARGRHGDAQPERAAAGHAAGRGRAAVDARPAARRPERSELPRLPVPGRLRLRAGDQPRGGEDRRRPRRARACSAGSPSTSSSCATRDGTWTPYAIELNLRKGGTTHPFLTLQFLTDGRYDPATALFTAPSGREKHLVATDHLESELLRGLTVDDLFDIAVRNRLHFDQARQTGVVFHMMSALTELGRSA